MPVGRRKAAPPILAEEWGPFGVGSPHWLQVMFLPRSISWSETHFCMGQRDLWVTGRVAMSTSVLRLSIPMWPSLPGALDQLHLWGLLSWPPLPSSRLFKARLCVRPSFPSKASFSAPQPRHNSEAPGVSTKLSTLRMSSTGDSPAVLPMILQIQRVSAPSQVGLAWYHPPLRLGVSPSSNNCFLF